MIDLLFADDEEAVLEGLEHQLRPMRTQLDAAYLERAGLAGELPRWRRLAAHVLETP